MKISFACSDAYNDMEYDDWFTAEDFKPIIQDTSMPTNELFKLGAYF
jgi:hypothetical protein